MKNIIDITIEFVKETLKNAEAGHDWFHIERVYNLSKRIANAYECNFLVVELGALLHDIADAKFHDGDEEVGPNLTVKFLKDNNINQSIIDQVVFIVKNISFKNRFSEIKEKPIELQIVQDADRLDAIGAIGIARAFTFGGFKNNIIYDPNILPNLAMSKEQYKKHNGTTINHFYEKLFLIKDLMNTSEGRSIAESRNKYMEDFLDRFYKEWDGTL